ncbi:MAG: HD domain-containing protein [Actinomycetes bacterium]
MTDAETEALQLSRSVLASQAVWLVGGAIRDRLGGVVDDAGCFDLDLIIDGDAEQAACDLRAAAPHGTASFSLSDQFGAWRVCGPEGHWQIDCTPLQGKSLADDLSSRDLTINAIAEPLAGGDLIDPTGGVADFERRILRAASSASFQIDPLRCVRLARFGAQLGFDVEPATLAASAAAAGGLVDVAGERIFAELNLILGSSEAVRGLELLDRSGSASVILPELGLLKGVEQTAYHHLDAYEHTLDVLRYAVSVSSSPGQFFNDPIASQVAQVLEEPLADGLSRGVGLRWGALLHDIAKPQTKAQFDNGRIGFPGHAVEGAALSRVILERFKASERLRFHVEKLTLEHLRLGFLVHEQPLTAEAFYLYLTSCQPVEVDVTLLSLADRLATRGRKSEEAISKHSELALEVLAEALRWRTNGPPAPLLRGDELALELGIEHGPQLGEALAAIAQAQYCGTVSTKPEAVELAAQVLAAGA